jgi:hypothetical protein
MRHVDIKTKIPELLAEIPPWEDFVRLGNLTKLRQDANGRFHHANYESGLLLYALVRHYRPTQILEIGTGRGYGAFCMAMALRDNGDLGRIVTLDVKSYTEKQDWPIDDGQGARVASLSLQEVWEGQLDPTLRAMIDLRQGFSSQGLAQFRAEKDFRPQFVYIDGDHSYTITRHDLFASWLLVDSPFCILLDDYMPRSDLYGVRRLVDDELEPLFELEAIHNDRRWYGEEREATPLTDSTYAQVLLDSRKVKQEWQLTFPRHELERVVEAHQRWGRYSLMRENALLRWRKNVVGLERRA